MHLATGAFDPGRGYTSPPGLEPHVVDLPQRSWRLGGRNKRKGARAQRRKGRGSPAETWLSQRQIDIGLEGFLGGIVGRVGVDFEAGRAIEFQFLVACDSVRDAPSVT